MNEFYISGIANKGLFAGGAIAILIIPAALLFMSIYFAHGLRTAKVVVDDKHISFKAAIYGREVDRSNIDIDNVSTLRNSSEGVDIRYRTNGISIFGVNWGWFKASSGRKLLMFVTDIGDAVVVPTKLDYDIVISVRNPEKFVNKLKN